MKKLIEYIKSLKFIFMPRYWIMNNEYNKQWDKMLNELMEKENFKAFDEYTAMLGGVEVRTSNHPYASMTPINLDVRPSRLTIQKAHKKLTDDTIKTLR